MDCQQTIVDSVSFSGISLMLGVQASMTFKPAPIDSGVVFVRTDLPQHPSVKADIFHHVSEIPHCTSVRDGEACVNSIEHLLSALAGLRIDNILIEIDALEPPAADGSALPYVELLQQAGICQQDAQRRYIDISETIAVSELGKQIIMQPSEQFQITFAFDHPHLPTQLASFTIDESTYLEQIAGARTFIFTDEIEFLKAQGIGKGASKDNVVVIDIDGTPDASLRYPNEMVRHKILDLIGDIYLLGGIPRAHLTAIRSGHTLNTRLAQSVSEQISKSKQWDVISTSLPIEAAEIYSLMEHRYPLFMVDRIVEIEEGKRGVGIKNITFNELFFQGHFPGQPIMPAVLQLEALAQTAGYLIKRLPEHRDKFGFFAGMDKVKFRKTVLPGDQLRLEVEIITLRNRFAKIKGVASVDGQTTAEAEMMFFLGNDE